MAIITRTMKRKQSEYRRKIQRLSHDYEAIFSAFRRGVLNDVEFVAACKALIAELDKL